MLHRFKFFSFFLVIIYAGVTYYILDRLFFIPFRDYSLFESGMVNIFNNYIFLLCLLGLSIIMADIKKSLSYIYI